MTNIIKNNLEIINRRIAAAALRSGRRPEDITLVAVSKVHPTSAIREAYEAGQRHFGENYAQELKDKHEMLSDLVNIKWHFIGHLQRNKAKIVATTNAVVETVDSVRLADTLDRAAENEGQRLPVMIQVNVGREHQKSGTTTEALPALLDRVERFEHLRLTGLMTIPPYDLDSDETRKYFESLRDLRDANGGVVRLPHLSMGMSHDFEAAIEEGATHVRVGTAIFGRRPLRR
jgi:hypothetical protein